MQCGLLIRLELFPAGIPCAQQFGTSALQKLASNRELAVFSAC